MDFFFYSRCIVHVYNMPRTRRAVHPTRLCLLLWPDDEIFTWLDTSRSIIHRDLGGLWTHIEFYLHQVPLAHMVNLTGGEPRIRNVSATTANWNTAPLDVEQCFTSFFFSYTLESKVKLPQHTKLMMIKHLGTIPLQRCCLFLFVFCLYRWWCHISYIYSAVVFLVSRLERL